MEYIKKNLSKMHFRIIGLVIFILIAMSQDFSLIIKTLLKVNPFIFVISVFLILPYIILRAIRWNIIMEHYGLGTNLKESTVIYFSALFLGVASPGRLGEFSKVFYIQEKGYPFSVSFVTVLLDRFCDLITLLLLGLICLVIFRSDFQSIFILYLALIGSLFVFWKFRLFPTSIKILIPKSIINRIEVIMLELSKIRSMPRGSLINIFLINLVILIPLYNGIC